MQLFADTWWWILDTVQDYGALLEVHVTRQKNHRQNGISVVYVRHHRSVAYSVELVLLNKHQVYGGAPKLH